MAGLGIEVILAMFRFNPRLDPKQRNGARRTVSFFGKDASDPLVFEGIASGKEKTGNGSKV